jgi:hypothetical protein
MSPTISALEPAWTADWLWGVSLIALTLMVHAFGIALIAIVLVRVNARHRSGISHLRVVTESTAVIGAVGVSLALLHGVEAALWAAAYLGLGAVASVADAMLYSVDSITTRGASGLELAKHWRMMGALESADGMLLFGTSTAFLFAVLGETWRMLALTRRRSARTKTPREVAD